MNSAIKNENANLYIRPILCQTEFYLILIRHILKKLMLNATFNNISVISWWSVLLVEKTGVAVSVTYFKGKALIFYN